jgi:peptidoglycan hydrolase FlgJ
MDISALKMPSAKVNLNTAQTKPTGTGQADVDDALAVRDAFTSFVGETFFSQMIKSMRSTTDKSAYFHGGKGEEIFTAQLDQVLSGEMTTASADQFANPMFERQFPHLGARIREYESAKQPPLFDARG